ncbi:hypothetical protein GCM10009801_46360 [Streptomyces albiaxialis]|uniref:DUF397 domain-containing protein n=1 Tax=Streptomyces albiaxialis TaxID=329523 RepID=A0ABN2W9Y0_9ACTN
MSSSSAVERPLTTWRRSSYSDAQGGECVEIGTSPSGLVPVRDSKAPENGTLQFSGAAWSAFISKCRGPRPAGPGASW